MTSESGQVPAACATPIDPAVLMDYWQALLPADEEAAVEEHLFTCDACGDRLREVIDLAESLRGLARSGALFVVVSDTLRQQAEATGQRVRKYDAVTGRRCCARSRPTTTC